MRIMRSTTHYGVQESPWNVTVAQPISGSFSPVSSVFPNRTQFNVLLIIIVDLACILRMLLLNRKPTFVDYVSACLYRLVLYIIQEVGVESRTL